MTTMIVIQAGRNERTLFLSYHRNQIKIKTSNVDKGKSSCHLLYGYLEDSTVVTVGLYLVSEG